MCHLSPGRRWKSGQDWKKVFEETITENFSKFTKDKKLHRFKDIELYHQVLTDIYRTLHKAVSDGYDFQVPTDKTIHSIAWVRKLNSKKTKKTEILQNVSPTTVEFNEKSIICI